jgi:threonine aldolase
MRAAMAAAEVGDDVYIEDPTVLLLEERAAAIFGREAALFVPTGTMGNQIAIRLHTQHGQEIICESRAHILDWEMATMSAFSGCMPRTTFAEGGILRWEQIKALIAPNVYYHATTGLIVIENTHNFAGGTVTPLDVLDEIWRNAKAAGLPVHLDGARVFNAAVALDCSVAELTSGFDTVMFCLSKGLCAPVGSMLVGPRKAMDRARVLRKALGGGMRQVGVLAAAGLIALEQMPKRLHEDHANARMIASRLAMLERVRLDMNSVQTNIVLFSLEGVSAVEVVRHAREAGVLVSAFGASDVRLVTHNDVDQAACKRAADVLARAIESASHGAV